MSNAQNIGELVYNRNFYYILGLIATDGSICKTTLSFEISQKDEELISFFEIVFSDYGFSVSRRVFENSSGTLSRAVRFRLNSTYLCSKLKGLGIHPRKSRTISDVLVPDRYWVDFFRGCIDGDGSVSNRRNSIELELCSASYKFLEF